MRIKYLNAVLCSLKYEPPYTHKTKLKGKTKMFNLNRQLDVI